MDMLRLGHVRKVFGPTVAVDGISLSVTRGEILGLLGPNGAGKTTTVHMAAGLLAPDGGQVDVAGVGPPTDASVRAHIGVAPQALALYEELTGAQNLHFFGKLYGLSGGRLSDRVEASLAFVGLSGRGGDRVRTYSGGMKRRLNLAVGLVADPPLMLLDEPTVGVDPQSRNAIFENILALKREGRAILYTTHYMEEAQRLCDRVAIMDHGKLLAIDGVEGLIAAHGGASVLTATGTNGEVVIETHDPLAELARLQARGPLLRFTVDQPDLERVFLNLTGRSLRD